MRACAWGAAMQSVGTFWLPCFRTSRATVACGVDGCPWPSSRRSSLPQQLWCPLAVVPHVNVVEKAILCPDRSARETPVSNQRFQFHMIGQHLACWRLS